VFFTHPSSLADTLPAGKNFPAILPPPQSEEGEVDEGGSGALEGDRNSESENGQRPASPSADPDGEQHGSSPSPEESQVPEATDSIARAVMTRRRLDVQKKLLSRQQAQEKVRQRAQLAQQASDVESEEGGSGGELNNGPNLPAPPAPAGNGRSKGKEKEASVGVIRAAKKKEYKLAQVIVDLTGRVSRCQHPPSSFLLTPIQEYDSEIEDLQTLRTPTASELFSHDRWPHPNHAVASKNATHNHTL
jgi:hypothetical protein